MRPEMLDGAYWDPVAEDAAAAWRTMIRVSNGTMSGDGIVIEQETP
jgi:hypothetical protein